MAQKKRAKKRKTKKQQKQQHWYTTADHPDHNTHVNKDNTAMQYSRPEAADLQLSANVS